MSVSVNIRVRLRPDNKLTIMARRTGKLTPEEVAKIIQYALRASLLAGIKRRYAARGFDMQYVYRAGQNNASNFNSLHVRQRLLRLARLIAREQERAEETGRRGRLNELLQEQRDVLAEFSLGARPLMKHRGKQSSRVRAALDKATAQKRAAMGRVLQVLAGSDPFVVEPTASGVRVGVGVVSVLRGIETPSATKILQGKRSNSLYRQLWLQMEYGAGQFAKASPNLHTSPYKTGTGSWWYGPKAGKGIHFIGQKPGNLLRDQSGLPYGAEGRLFQRLFAERMNQMLFGE